MFKMIINRFFQASHQLPDSKDLVSKDCLNLHGHSYLCKVTFESEENKRTGMVVDFKAIGEIIDKLDHKFINEVFEKESFKVESTAENIAVFIYNKIIKQFPDLEMLEVSICEGFKGEQSNWITYDGK